MTKKTISKQQVIEAAKLLVANGHNVTLIAIRQQLGHSGSLSTIHKYLSQWKQQCFKRMVTNTDETSSNDLILIEEFRALKLELQKQISRNEIYANELINTETTIIKLTEANQQLQATVQQLQTNLDTVTKEKVILEDCYQKLTKEIVSNRDATILQQEQTIESLRQEIQTINQTSFNAVQQISFAGHDALLQEKVKSLNLEEKVKELQQLVVQQQNKLAILSKALQQQQPLEFANYERIGHG
jgi:hypothetical protein